MGMISNENLNEFLKEVREKAKGEDKLLEQFERCFLNTLETTVRMKEDGTVYVITGDIPAMWLRDSTAQIRPFLFPAKENEEIRQMIAGLVKRQFYAAVRPGPLPGVRAEEPAALYAVEIKSQRRLCGGA